MQDAQLLVRSAALIAHESKVFSTYLAREKEMTKVLLVKDEEDQASALEQVLSVLGKG
jgi:PleD family two-component response regulator